VWTLLRESELAEAFTTASTLLGVTVLGYPGQLLELDITAVAAPRDAQSGSAGGVSDTFR
jgi:hypothetical protein